MQRHAHAHAQVHHAGPRPRPRSRSLSRHRPRQGLLGGDVTRALMVNLAMSIITGTAPAVVFLLLLSSAVIPSPLPHGHQHMHHDNSRNPNISLSADDLSVPLKSVTPAVPPQGCSIMSGLGAVSDVSLLQSMNGWPAMLDYVRKDLDLIDDIWDDIQVSNSNFLQLTSGVLTYWCPEVDDAQWTWDPTEHCFLNEESSPIYLVGNGQNVLLGSAKATIELQQKAKVQRLKNFEFGTSLWLKGVIDVPFLKDGRFFQSFSWSMYVEDSVTDITTDTINQEISAQVISRNPSAMCDVHLKLNTCRRTGKGVIHVYAEGWIWFHFPVKVKGHTNWGYRIESIITNKTDRSALQHLEANISANGHGFVSLICDGVPVTSNVTLNGTQVQLSGTVVNASAATFTTLPSLPTLFN